MINIEDVKQLLKSSGSIGANYIKVNEALSKKDFIHRLKICRKEAKETRYWLYLIDLEGNNVKKDYLIKEVTELMHIFGAIITKNT